MKINKKNLYPKVSIVTPTFNSENTIESTLKSILKQNFANYEHIIIDGKSSDNTLELIKKISPDSIIFSDYDDGIYDAFNKGIEKATGDIICFLNSDDSYASETILKDVTNIFDSENLDIVLTNINVRDNKKNLVRKYPAVDISVENLESGFMPPHPGCFIKKNIFTKIGTFSKEFKICGDYEHFCRVAKVIDQLDFCILDIVSVNMAEGGISTRNLTSRLLLHNEIIKALSMNNFKVNHFRLLSRYFKKISQLKF